MDRDYLVARKSINAIGKDYKDIMAELNVNRGFSITTLLWKKLPSN
jgi:hypothetical protein